MKGIRDSSQDKRQCCTKEEFKSILTIIHDWHPFFWIKKRSEILFCIVWDIWFTWRGNETWPIHCQCYTLLFYFIFVCTVISILWGCSFWYLFISRALWVFCKFRGTFALYVSVEMLISSACMLKWLNCMSITDSASEHWWKICCVLKWSWLRNQTAEFLLPAKML